MVIPFLFACGRSAKERAAELQVRTDSLMQQTSQKDVAINDFVKSINDIEGMLDSIKTRENIVSLKAHNTGELKVSSRDQIRSDIVSIYDLMLKNKEQLNNLSHRLRMSGVKNSEMEKLIDRLQKDLSDKVTELDALRDKVSKMDIAMADAHKKLDTLSNIIQTQNAQITVQEAKIDAQTNTLNTAWYFIGTRKELKDAGIIKGGKILADFNKSKFRKVDISKTNEILLGMKKVKMLSVHPSSSYKLNKKGKEIESLEVTDNMAFWSDSKFLVIEVDKPLALK